MDAGFLIVTEFEVLYRRFAGDPRFDRGIYALPMADTSPTRVGVRYRGLDRNPLESFRVFFEALNSHGLFDSPDTATLFLRHYLSLEWTARGEFEIVEVFLPDRRLETRRCS